MKIIHVITRLIIGGAQENTLLSCEGLSKNHDVILVTGPGRGAEGNMNDRAKGGGYRVHFVRWLVRSLHPLYDVAAFVWLWGFFVRERPDIVHTHSSKAGVLGRIAARLAGVPVVVHTVHGLPFHEHQSRSAHIVYRACEWVCGMLTNGLVCVGEEMKRKAIKARMGKEIDVVYSGIEVDRFDPSKIDRHEMRKHHNLPTDAVVLCCVSRLAPLKGHQEILDAFSRLEARAPKLVLCCVGDGELRETLERTARRFGDRIRFLGRLEPTEIPAVLAASDILVHASLREGLPRACVEALLCEKPVVAVDADGAREVVIDGVTGKLVRECSGQALAEALLPLILDPMQAAKMGRAGAERFRDRFRAERMVADLERLYRRLGSVIGHA